MNSNNLKRLLCYACLFLVLPAIAFSQATSPAARGTVLNERSLPLQGASVQIENTSTGFKSTTQTSNVGTFSFPNLEPGIYKLTITSVGYADKILTGNTYSTGSPISLTINMDPTEKTLEDVVVVGYGKTTKRDVTGSVKSIKASEFNRGIINSPEELLQGKVAGVNVTSASGEPGGLQSITVRGPGGVRSGSTPLFVVDGMALDNATTGGATNPLSFLSPQDIESIDVLKDASATAIYGARGANGVVLITTKKGKAGLNTMTYSFTAGTSSLARKLPVYGASDYKREVAALGGTPIDMNGDTDWQKEITRSAFTQNHNLALSGGSNKLTYYGSFGMQLQEGIIKNNDLKRYTGRLNINQKFLDDRLVVDV
ncbi:MAG TPA: TonB-dependent receptor plug domain-containing protein, partial [Flavitalea sp.]|nr:TonB-dependent receptor plug domain-containing protein [Flavitalea sp.]